VAQRIQVPLEKTTEALEIFLGVVDTTLLAAPIGIRYVKGPTNALLGPNMFSPITAMIAFVSVDLLPNSRPLMQVIMEKFEERREEIPHTYHWGKQLPDNSDWVDVTYGDSITLWRAKRLELLGEVGARMFSNENMVELGII